VASPILTRLGQNLGLFSTPPDSDWAKFLQRASEDLQKLQRHIPPLPAALLGLTVPPPPITLFDRLNPVSIANSLGPAYLLIPSILCTFAFAALLVIHMAGWGRLSSWGSRFGSPFGRSAGNDSPSSDPPTVTDGDYSYITAADLASNRPHRDSDVVVLKHRRVIYPIHFPAYSIDDGGLTVGKLREAAAVKVELPKSDAGRIKLYFRGRILKDDTKLMKAEGFTSGGPQSEIMMVVGEKALNRDDDDDDEEEDDEIDAAAQREGGGKKKRRNRKKKRGGKGASNSETNSGTATPTGAASGKPFNPDSTFVSYAAPPPRPPPAQSAPPRLPPQTAIEKLDAIARQFHTKFVPDCVSFISGPPSDAHKKEFEHKKLTETILAQVLLKLDAVETEGDDAARQNRKALVKEVQGMLNQLDAAMK
jgi:hypothetical protein